jgi:putative glutamine amidotransferase
MSDPIIGVVMALTPEDHFYKVEPAYRFEYLKQHYYEGVESAGGVPIAIPLTERLEFVDRYCDLVDGFLFVGGEDVNPEVYGEPLDPLCRPQMPRRDHFEIRLLQAAFQRRIPILGICRGLQVMNVAFGGTLFQDLKYLPGAGNHAQIGERDFSTRHLVRIESGTLLHSIIGADQIEVNTSHHQAIKKLGAGLRIAAGAPDGVIEAVEMDGFTLGVQWHPEAWGHDKYSRLIFGAFCAAAAGTKA